MRKVPTPTATYSSPPAASIPTATPRFHPSRHTPLSLRKPASTSDHVAPPSLLSNGPPSRSSLVHVSAVERNATSRCLASRGSTASAVAHALRLDVGRSNVVASHVLAPSRLTAIRPSRSQSAYHVPSASDSRSTTRSSTLGDVSVGAHVAPRSSERWTLLPAATHAPATPGTPITRVTGPSSLPGRVHVAPPSCEAKTYPVSVTASIWRESGGCAATCVIAGTPSGSFSETDWKVSPRSVDIQSPVVAESRNTVFFAEGWITTACGSS